MFAHMRVQATRLVTSSEDDTSPVIMVWDLRNARAPEKVHTLAVYDGTVLNAFSSRS